jgi:GxxExxY protein
VFSRSFTVFNSLTFSDNNKYCNLVLSRQIFSTMTLLHQELTGSILNCAYKVHSTLGPGLIESAYEEYLHYELDKIGLEVIKQKPMPLIYEGKKLDLGYRIDLLVESKVILEIKSVEALNPVHMAQLMTYMKLSGCRVGFLINFNVESLKEGIKRVIM